LEECKRHNRTVGRRGPSPEPDNLRVLKGLKPRHPVAPPTDRPTPPDWLDALGADYFADLSGMAPHLRLADSLLLAQLADNLSRADLYREELRKAPLVRDAHGDQRRNPISFLLRDVEDRAVKLYRELHLTPSSRSTLTTSPESADDRYNDLLDGPERLLT
jgi:phage terminase small subunit